MYVLLACRDNRKEPGPLNTTVPPVILEKTVSVWPLVTLVTNSSEVPEVITPAVPAVPLDALLPDLSKPPLVRVKVSVPAENVSPKAPAMLRLFMV